MFAISRSLFINGRCFWSSSTYFMYKFTWIEHIKIHNASAQWLLAVDKEMKLFDFSDLLVIRDKIDSCHWSPSILKFTINFKTSAYNILMNCNQFPILSLKYSKFNAVLFLLTVYFAITYYNRVNIFGFSSMILLLSVAIC